MVLNGYSFALCFTNRQANWTWDILIRSLFENQYQVRYLHICVETFIRQSLKFFKTGLSRHRRNNGKFYSTAYSNWLEWTNQWSEKSMRNVSSCQIRQLIFFGGRPFNFWPGGHPGEWFQAKISGTQTRGPFLKGPANFLGPKTNFKIQTCWIGSTVASPQTVNCASLSDSFIVLFSKLLKPWSGMQTQQTQNSFPSRIKWSALKNINACFLCQARENVGREKYHCLGRRRGGTQIFNHSSWLLSDKCVFVPEIIRNCSILISF